MFDFIKYKNIIYLAAFCIAGFQSTSVSAMDGESVEDDLTVRVLSIDGGVVRGAIPATILVDIEDKTGNSIAELFHIVGGTSIGCVLAASLTVPSKDNPLKPRSKMQDIIDKFSKAGPNIFRWRLPIGSIYDTGALENMVDDFCDRTTFDKSVIPTVGVAFDILAGKTKAFCSWDEEEMFLTRDVMLSSSAAPFFFYPRLVAPVNFNASIRSQYFLADGGVSANNPTTLIIAQARKLYPKANRFEVLSLGNGRIEEAAYISIFKGAAVLSSFLTRGFDIGLNVLSADRDEYTPDLIVGDYTRMNPVIPASTGSAVDASEANLLALQKHTQYYLEENKVKYAALIKRLEAPKCSVEKLKG